jgi:Protein O-mannosyl-transferase TMEM260-like
MSAGNRAGTSAARHLPYTDDTPRSGWGMDLRRLLSRVDPDVVLLMLGFFVAFALYARTVAPGVLDDDGGEFQTNIYRLGVSHTGYPLYFLLAKLWTVILPVGSFAYRANLFSSLFGALTVALIYITMRVLVDSRPVAFLTAILFAVSRVEWSQSVIPRVYTLNSFFVVLIILLALLWRSGRISLLWVVFAFGLSLTNHRTMIWFAPALGLFILIAEGRQVFRPKRFASLLAAFVLPLLLYLYIPLRGDSDVGVEYHATNFVDMILAGNASIWLRFGPPGFLWWRFTTAYLPLMLEQFTAIGAALGLVGIVAIARGYIPRGFPSSIPPRQFLLLLGAAHLVETAFAIVFWTLDSEKYFIPSYLTFLPFVGIGAALLVERLGRLRISPLPLSRLLWLSPAAVLLAMCLYLGETNFAGQDQSANDLAQSRWQDILSQPLETNALLVGNWESLTPLEFYQYVENVRRDLQRDKVVIFRDQLVLAPQVDVAKFIAGKLANGQAVYMTLHPTQTETLGAIAQRFNLVPVDSLWRVEIKRAPRPPQSVQVRFGDSLILKSVASSPNLAAGDFAETTLDWQAVRPLDARYKFSFRLRDSTGNLWMQRDVDPFGGLKQTTEWATGQDISDREGYFIPPDAPPGEYALSLAVYDSESHSALDAEGKAELTLTTVHVTPPKNVFPQEVYQIPHSIEISAAGGRLVGYGLSEQSPQAGSPLDLQAWWSGVATGSSNIQIELADGRGARTIAYQGSIVPNAASALDPRQTVRSVYPLLLSPAAAPGRAALDLIVDGRRTEIAQFDLRASDRLFSAPKMGYSQLATLDDSIQFLGYDLPNSTVNHGGQLTVKLYWHLAKPVTESYKVFVHLLDSEGILRGQQDSVPHAGALPTSEWLPGEYVADLYTLAVPSDVKAGDYRIEIGMYSPETGVRAAALDAQGVRLPDDRVLLQRSVQVTK